MPTEYEHEHTDPLAQMGYELEDVEYKGLGRSVGWFFVFVAFCGVAGFLIFGFAIGWDKIFNEPTTTSPFVKRVPGDPNPLLQTNVTARTDIRDLRRQEIQLLHGKPTWIDDRHTAVRIPIERAIDLYSRQMAASPNGTMISGAPPTSNDQPITDQKVAQPSGHS